MKKNKKPGKRNPVAKNLNRNKSKVIPNKRKKLQEKAKKPEHAPIIKGGLNATYDGM